jgi:glycosyltransferase involved in cell wall biosynthesis
MDILLIIYKIERNVNKNKFIEYVDFLQLKGHRVFIAFITDQDSSLETGAYFNTNCEQFVLKDLSEAVMKGCYDEIGDWLKNNNVKPSWIEVFDSIQFAYTLLQCKFVNIGMATSVPVVVSFIDPVPLSMVSNYSLPSVFEEHQLAFVVQAASKVVSYHSAITKKIHSLKVASRILLNIQSDGLDATCQHDKIYQFLSKVWDEDNSIYPFVRGESKYFDLASTVPLVSVVIPYYNMGLYIQETIDSVLKSTYSNLEIILVDDGSTDLYSIAKIKEIEEVKNVVVLRQTNGGVAKARNAGIEAANGEIIALLDADDMVAPSYFGKAVEVLKKFKNVSFVGSWVTMFSKTGAPVSWITHTPEPPTCLLMNTVNSQALVVKKEALQSHGLHDSSLNMYLDDWESVVSMVLSGARGVIIPEFLFFYRIRQNSVFRFNQNMWTESYGKIMEKHYSKMAIYSKDIIQMLLVNGPNIFYKDQSRNTDFWLLLSSTKNYRIRNSYLTKGINRYYNLVELVPIFALVRSWVNKILK